MRERKEPGYQLVKDQMQEKISNIISEWFEAQDAGVCAQEIKRKLDKHRTNILGEILGFDTKWNEWKLKEHGTASKFSQKLQDQIEKSLEKYFDAKIKNMIESKVAENLRDKIEMFSWHRAFRGIDEKIESVIQEKIGSISPDEILSEIENVYLKLKDMN